MNWKFTAWIEQKLSDQETKDNKNSFIKDNNTKVSLRILGSILVALSGFILFADKVTNFQFENNFNFPDTETLIWVVSQTLSPILLIIAVAFKPYKTSYLIPVYIYTIQFIWIFQPHIRFDDYYLQSYAIGACIGFMALFYVIYKINVLKSKRQKENELFKQEALETMELLRNDILTTDS